MEALPHFVFAAAILCKSVPSSPLPLLLRPSLEWRGMSISRGNTRHACCVPCGECLVCPVAVDCRGGAEG